MAQTRTVAPASGMPRELKTMSSLREPCPFATGTIGHAWNSNASATQRNPIAIFDRIIGCLFPKQNTQDSSPFVPSPPMLVWPPTDGAEWLSGSLCKPVRLGHLSIPSSHAIREVLVCTRHTRDSVGAGLVPVYRRMV